MILKRTKLNILHGTKDLAGAAKSGVSLHCHTEHSKELLDFLPHYGEKLPIISFFYKREKIKYLEREGREMDLSVGHWSPPLTANQVYDIEKSQINDIGLEAVISLTDHDCIAANLKVNETTENSVAPISLEWTVPYDYGFFHLGVHNLPKDRAIEITKSLLDFTFIEENQTPENLNGLFAMLNEIQEVLIVFNHPIWDIELVGRVKHEALLKNFLREYGKWLHALEINGFRTWSENKAVIELAEALGFPLVTGGDRHGCKPNTVLNLTNSKTFSEFVEEIRIDKQSEVVLMPEYKRPLHSRQMQSFSEILKYYDDFPEGRKKWFDRVYVDSGDGEGIRQLSVHWDNGGPIWLRAAIWTLGVLGSPRMRPIFTLAQKKRDKVPNNIKNAKFDATNLDELASGYGGDQSQSTTEFAS